MDLKEKFFKETTHFSGCWMFLKKWNESKASKTLLSPCNFNSHHRGLSPQKCKKNFCPRKILTNVQIKYPIIMGDHGDILLYYLIDLSTNYMTQKNIWFHFMSCFIKKFYNQNCWIKFNLITFTLTCGWLH